MTETPILLISGALRAQSYNRMLLREAARLFDAPATEADLRLPLYDGDLEADSGIPHPVQRLADQIAVAPAVMIATPEYNSGLSGVLKNALDWVSRTEGTPWAGKPVAIMSAAAGRSGGAQAQDTLRQAMTAFRPLLLTGPQVMVANAAEQFDATGRLTNERYSAALGALMTDLRRHAGL